MRCIFSMQATKQMVEKKYTMQCAKPCGCKVASKETYFQYRYHNNPLNSAEFWDYSNSHYLRLLIWNCKNVHHIKVQMNNSWGSLKKVLYDTNWLALRIVVQFMSLWLRNGSGKTCSWKKYVLVYFNCQKQERKMF